MPDSTRAATVQKWRKWKSQHPEWPLTVAPNGQWCKKVRGKTWYFGSLEDRDIALRVWLAEKDYLQAGEEPPDHGEGMTIAELCDSFRSHTEARLAASEISSSYAKSLLFAVRFIMEHTVASRSVCSLTPGHFARLREAVATGRNPRSQKHLILAIRHIISWGEGMEYYESIKFGPQFKPPTSVAIARDKANSEGRFLDRDTVLAMLTAAKPGMKCAILLGINCGFYASDSASLKMTRLHLTHEIPHHDYARAKNGRRRLAALWPETVDAINDYVENHRKKNNSDCLLISSLGEPYSLDSAANKFRIMFTRLAKRVRVRLPVGASIGSLRHTYGTVVDLSADQQSIDLSMGHSPKGMQKRIYSQLNIGELDRLKALSEIVRRWLYHNELPGVTMPK